MPSIIQSPEGWFREKEKDLYTFDYCARWELHASKTKESAQQSEYRRNLQNLKTWLSSDLHETPLTRFSASEYSGRIEGGHGYLAAEMDDAKVAQFNETWNFPDSPWRLKILLYADWLKKINSCQLLSTPLAARQPLRWWDTPHGFMLLSATREGSLLSKRDAWWRIPQLIPALQEIKPESLPYGEYWPFPESRSGYILIDCGDISIESWKSRKYAKDTVRITLLREALGITKNQNIGIYVSDF
ncbi:MAG: hypothetical protein FIA97_15095 [Methylococcaceae bacterium]|nr:hypothetical protein [Methylococcaceae bacterium]